LSPIRTVSALLACLLIPGSALATTAEHVRRLAPDIDPNTLSSPRIRVLDGTHIAHHARYVDGARVLDQDLVTVTRGADERAWGHLAPVTAAPRQLDALIADLVLREHFPGAAVGELEAVLVPTEGRTTHRHAWVGQVQPARGLPLIVQLDAVDGSVIQAVSAAQDVEAAVSVYPHNPLHGAAETRVVDVDQAGVLWTEQITVIDEELQTPLVSDDFVFSPDDDAFTFTSVYFHLQDATAWMNDTVPGGAIEAPTVAFVNVGQSNMFGDPMVAANAFHLWRDDDAFAGHVLVFGGGLSVGSATVPNLGHSGDVVAHELGHGLIDEIVPFHPSDFKGEHGFRALHEGLADYAAASHLGVPAIADHAFADLGGGRDLSDVRVYPDDWDTAAGQHSNGRIVGSLGWTLRQDIGAPSDTIMLSSPAYLSASEHGFDGLVRGMLGVNTDVYDGRYLVPVLEALDAHGLRPSGQGERPAAHVEIERLRAPRGVQRTLTVDIDDPDGHALVGVEWDLAVTPNGSEITDLGASRFDRELSFTPDVCGDFELRVRVADEGNRTSGWQYVTVATCPQGCASSVAGADAVPGASLLLLLLGAPLVRRRRR